MKKKITDAMLCFEDKRPLTEETIKELGFVQTDTFNWINGDMKLWMSNGQVVINIAESLTFKTVGSVKMLIEALKGDE